jgi:hypothetical protein
MRTQTRSRTTASCLFATRGGWLKAQAERSTTERKEDARCEVIESLSERVVRLNTNRRK